MGEITAKNIAKNSDQKNFFLYGAANWNTLLNKEKSKTFLAFTVSIMQQRY